MDEDTIKLIADNLRKPMGDMGLQVAEKMNTGNELMNRRTIERLNISPGDNILEIGMGNGFFVEDILYVDDSIKYTGADYSELMIREADKINNHFIETGRAQFYLSNADKLPFVDESFNKLFTVNTIYFWENPENTLKEFRRVLKPGGMLIITFRPKWNMEKIPFTQYGFTLYSTKDVTELLSSNGFDILSAVEMNEPNVIFEDVEMKRASVVVCAERNKE